MDVDMMLEQLACSQHAEESLEFLYCCGESLVNANSYDLFVVFNRAVTVGESLRRHVVGQRLGAAWERAACEVIVGYWTAENIRFEESLQWSRAVINALESVCGYIVPALQTAHVIRDMNVNIDGLLSAVKTLLHRREQVDPTVAREAHRFRLAVQLLENLSDKGPSLQRVLEEEMDEENLLPDSFSGTFNWSVPPIETCFRCSTQTERTLYRWTMYTCMRMELLGPFFETLNMRRLFIAKTVGFGFPGVFKLEVSRFLRNCSKRVLLDRKDFNRAALVVCFRCKDMGELDLTRIDFKRIFFGVVRSLPFGIGFQLMSVGSILCSPFLGDPTMLQECDVLINTPFFLVESPVYMKAMMSALEYMRNGELLVRNPLYQTILQGNTGPSTTPRYLRGTLDVRDLYVEKKVPIYWQPESGALPVAESELDTQGLAACRAAMTSEVVLLEGVPQTRKLAIVKLIEVLTRNQRGLPVVLLSFTNFAVDKMLLMLQERVPTANIVRLGGNVSDRGMQFKVTKKVDRKGARAARASLEQAVRRVSDWLASKGTAHVESLMIVHVPTSQLLSLFEKGMGGRNYHPEIHNDLYSFVGMQLVFYLQAWLRGEKVRRGAKWNNSQLRRGMVPWSELRRCIRGAIEVVKRNVEEELVPFGYEPVEFPALKGRLADLTAYRRDAIVDCVLSQACARVNHMFLSSLRECDLKRVELEAVDQAAVCRAARKATVVGMTATFASLNRSIIERLSPCVIIAEGATQCLEPLLVSCLTSPCLEHLILVGNSRKHLPSLRYVKLRNTLFQRSLTSRLVSAGHPCYSLGLTESARPADCHVVYPCGHRCLQKARPLHSHERCRHPCQRALVCGHVCSNLCSEPCVGICEEPCSMGCPHGRCPNLCHETCASCQEPCPFQCLCPDRNPKKLCSHLCYNECGKKLCKARCHRTCACGERCASFCGDPCHPCFRCDLPGATCPLTKRKLALKGPADIVVHLSCGHTLFHDAFVAYVAEQIASDKVQLLRCPSEGCREPIDSHRYRGEIEAMAQRVESAKRMAERSTRLTLEASKWRYSKGRVVHITGQCVPVLPLKECFVEGPVSDDELDLFQEEDGMGSPPSCTEKCDTNSLTSEVVWDDRWSDGDKAVRVSACPTPQREPLTSLDPDTDSECVRRKLLTSLPTVDPDTDSECVCWDNADQFDELETKPAVDSETDSESVRRNYQISLPTVDPDTDSECVCWDNADQFDEPETKPAVDSETDSESVRRNSPISFVPAYPDTDSESVRRNYQISLPTVDPDTDSECVCWDHADQFDELETSSHPRRAPCVEKGVVGGGCFRIVRKRRMRLVM